MSNVRVGGQNHVHKRVRGGNTACGMSKGKHTMFVASGGVSCPACHVRPHLHEPRKALRVAESLPVSKGSPDHVSVLAEAMFAVISVEA
jgi:hypothetical protein